MLCGCLVGIAPAGGCAAGRSIEPVKTSGAPGGGRETVVTGDWNDVYAAAAVGVPQTEGAITGRSFEDGREVIRLITIKDRPGTLVAERLGARSDHPQPIRLEVRVGYFGDPETEDRILSAVAARLRDLAGVTWAPIRGGR